MPPTEDPHSPIGAARLALTLVDLPKSSLTDLRSLFGPDTNRPSTAVVSREMEKQRSLAWHFFCHQSVTTRAIKIKSRPKGMLAYRNLPPSCGNVDGMLH